jgi:aspartate 1-decarboxylase
MSFGLLSNEGAKGHTPTVIVLNDSNEIISRRGI